jgi:hypothetical protein
MVACFTGTLCFAQAEASKPTQPFLIFPDTKSPDGRHAIAWGLPKHSEVWAKVCRFAEQYPLGAELSEQHWKEGSEVFDSVH